MEIDHITYARGSKRPAGDDRDNEQRLTKRFRSLSLRNDGGPNPGAITSAPLDSLHVDEAMHLDDTANKIYIHDLDRELEGLEPTKGTIEFLPDIEKRFTRIPQALLTSSDTSSKNKQMVLYNVPSSITVPEEQDNVRRAIIETRARAKAKKKAEEDAVKLHVPIHDETNTVTDHAANGYFDPDAMDIG